MRLQQAIFSEIEKESVQASVFVKEITTSEILAEIAIDKPMVSASIIKIPIMVYGLTQVAQNKMSLTEMFLVKQSDILPDTKVFEYGEKEYTLRELLSWMMVSSDNTATNVVIDLFGLDNLNSFFLAAGLRQTKLRRKMLDSEALAKGIQNETSAKDMFRLTSLLYGQKILTPALCEFGMDLLYYQRDKSGVLRYLPTQKAAHKTGELYKVRNDVGFLFLDGGRVRFFAIFLQGEEDKKTARLMGRIGEIIGKN